VAKSGSTPRGFYVHAVAFSDAADTVHASNVADPLPRYFLWGRAIELALKSFLLAEGVPIGHLKSKSVGHNLQALFDAAEARGISELISPSGLDRGIVRLLNFDYMSKRFEYRETGATYGLPDPILLRRLIRRLLKGVDFHLRVRRGV
jgi:hypothetical protein